MDSLIVHAMPMYSRVPVGGSCQLEIGTTSCMQCQCIARVPVGGSCQLEIGTTVSIAGLKRESNARLLTLSGGMPQTEAAKALPQRLGSTALGLQYVHALM